MQRTYFLYGNDTNSISQRIREISKDISGLNNEHINFEKIEFNNLQDVENFLCQGSNMPIFSTTSILEISLNIKIKLDDDFVLRFLNLIKAISIHKIVILVVYIEKYDKNVQKTLSENELFKNLSKIAKPEQHTKLMFWQKDQIASKITHLANQFNLKFENNSLSLFIDCIKEDLDNIHSELQKIQTYLLPENIINEQVVKDLYFTSYNFDDLYNALITSKNYSIFSLLSGIGRLKNPLYVIASLQNRLRQALELKIYLEVGKNNYEISKIVGMHSYKVEKELQQLRHLSSDKINKLLQELSNIEFKIKSGVAKDENALDMLLVRIL